MGHAFEEPKRWQLHNINEIMNTVVTGWKPFSNPRMFAGYGRQRGWERESSGNELPDNEDGFVELSEGAAKGVDCLIYRACCPVGCRLVANFVVTKMGVWTR